MTLKEVNQRLETAEITEEQFWYLNPLYLLLDLDKDDFCKIIDVVGLEELLKRRQQYKRLLKADEMLAEEERYLADKLRLSELECEMDELRERTKKHGFWQMF